MDNPFVGRLSNIIQANLAYSFLTLYLAAVITILGIQYVTREGTVEADFKLSGEEFLEAENGSIFAEIAGAINKPGVYEFSSVSRLTELVNEAGGFSRDASEEWVSKYLNLSSRLTDSQKVYIPFKWDDPAESVGQHDVAVLINPYTKTQTQLSSGQTDDANNQEEVGGKTNVNTASQEDVDALSGIGPVYAARIIENRPYDDFLSFVEKSGIPKGVLEKIQDQIRF